MKPIFSIIFFHFVFALTVCFQTCAPRNEWQSAKPGFNTNPVFYPYIEKFEYYSKLDTYLVPIRFSKLMRVFGGTTVGICRIFKIKGLITSAYIEIDEDSWNNITELQKINLIFHELGHCVLHREHTAVDNYVNACPQSFMDSFLLTPYCIETNYDEYIREMFPLWKE